MTKDDSHQWARSEGAAPDDLWEHDRQVYHILRESQDVEEGRIALFNYFKDLEWRYRRGEINVHKLEYATAMEALRVFSNLISPRNEEIAGFSTLEYLWRLANGLTEPAPGFVEEFKHLLKAINGQSGLSEGWLGPVLAGEGVEPVDFAAIEGRAAGVARSVIGRHAGWHKGAGTAAIGRRPRIGGRKCPRRQGSARQHAGLLAARRHFHRPGRRRLARFPSGRYDGVGR